MTFESENQWHVGENTPYYHAGAEGNCANCGLTMEEQKG
jgi:hypothetical protein